MEVSNASADSWFQFLMVLLIKENLSLKSQNGALWGRPDQYMYMLCGTWWPSLSRLCATSQKVAASILE